MKHWAFPRIDPHTVNDMRINYAQGSRQAKLATVDAAGGGASLGSTVSVTGDCFIILFKWIYCKAQQASRGGLEQMINTQNKYIPLELSELLIKYKL